MCEKRVFFYPSNDRVKAFKYEKSPLFLCPLAERRKLTFPIKNYAFVPIYFTHDINVLHSFQSYASYDHV